MAYVLTKNNEKMALYSLPNMDGYSFSPRKNKTIISVNKVVVVNPVLVDNILSIKFNEKFRALLQMAQYVLNSDTDDTSGIAIALDEVSMLKGILLNRYQHFLSKEKEELFLQKLRIIENQLRSKEAAMRMNYYQIMEEEQSKGKSR